MKKLTTLIIKHKKEIFFFLILLILIFVNKDSFARLGGAGGSSSNGGNGGDGIGSLIFYIIMLIPFPFNIILIAIIVAGYIYFNKKNKQKTIFNKMPTGVPTGTKPEGYESFILNNPTFDENKFKEKVKTAFTDLQYAWQDKNMSKVRKFLSDGMYQRLNTQFKMMDLLAQKNTIEKLNIKNIHIDKVETDGLYDIVHVAIHASVVDKFISEKYKSLNSGGAEDFVEYWSFLRKRGIEENDIYSSNNCPKCGGELPKETGEVAKCEFCGSMINSGEFDWVLSEITQADDYIAANPVIKAGNLSDAVMKLVENNEDFAVQLIEDKASNGYLQIETARVMKNPKLMRRFVSDEIFDKLSEQFKNEENFVYNRLYLNDVSLIGVMQKDNKNVLTIAIKSSYQRVIPKDKKAELIDYAVTTKTEVIFMSRDINAGKSKGSLYSHNCPACGGPVDDSLDTKCQYCGSELNSTSNEWIITNIMDIQSYYNYYATNAANFVAKINPEKIDGLYKVRDYAFNNVLIMVAADGNFDNEELEFTKKLAKKWGYNINKIEPMFKMAQNGKLVLRMPEDMKSRQKIYKLMEKAAQIDGNISSQEQQLLDNIKQQYL